MRRVVMWTVLIAEAWAVLADPMGGYLQAWLFDESLSLGIYVFWGLTPIEDLVGYPIVASATACSVIVFSSFKNPSARS